MEINRRRIKNFLVSIWNQKNTVETRGGKYNRPYVFKSKE